MVTSSGTYNFELNNSDIILEAFDRCELRPPAITGEHMVSAKRSLNLELQRWSNIGVNLWCVDLITQTLQQGVSTYSVPNDTVSLLDVYIRTFSLTETFNVTPNFSTVISSTTITIVISNHGLVTNDWINVVTPVAISNLLLSGFYQVTNVIDTNTFTVAASSAAAATVTAGGALPIFTAIAGQSAVNVLLPNHGEVIGENFIVGASTTVGGITLYGAYQVSGVTDSSNFGISTLQQALTNETVTENYGFAQVGAQTSNADPIDNIMSPMGRTDYAMFPDKFVQGKPSTYWFNRQINPQITIWQVPDQNGPYQLCMYRMRRVQDASPTMGQTPEIPYRFIDTLCARMALRLAMKYAKPMIPVLEKEAMTAWSEAAIEDRERADIMIMPDLSGYYRD